jgi:uridine kinase
LGLGARLSRSELLDELTARIAAVEREHPVRVAIDGIDGAGKTTLADELVAPLTARGRHVIRAGVDSFHHPAGRRHRRGAASAEGYFHDSFDYPGLRDALLLPLGPGGDCHIRRAIFDYRRDAVVEAPRETAPPDSVLLFDGVFLLRPELRDFWDLSIFVRAGFDVTLARAEVRDVDYLGGVAAVRQRYNTRYIPGQALYLESVRPEVHASFVVHNDDPARPILVRRGALKRTARRSS